MLRFVIAAAMCCLATMASAVEINFAAVLLDQDDQPIMDCVKADPQVPSKCISEVTRTLGRATFIALMTPAPEDQTMPPDEKKKRGDLALTAYLNKPANISVEDVVLIKKAISRQYGPLMVVRTFPLLEPK